MYRNCVIFVLIVILAGQKCGTERDFAKSTICLFPFCMIKMYNICHVLYNMIFLKFLFF